MEISEKESKMRKELTPKKLLYLIDDGRLYRLESRFRLSFDWEMWQEEKEIAKSLKHIDLITTINNTDYHMGGHDYYKFGSDPYLSEIQQELMETKWNQDKIGFREEKLWVILARNQSLGDELVTKFMDRPAKSELYAYVLRSGGYDIDNPTDKHIRKFVKGRMKLIDSRIYYQRNLGAVEIMRELRDIFVPGKMSEDTYLKYAKEVLRNTLKYDFADLKDRYNEKAFDQYEDVLLLVKGDGTNNNEYPNSYGYSMKASMAFNHDKGLRKLYIKAIKKLYLHKIKNDYGNILDNKEHITKIYDEIRKTDDDSKVDTLVDLVADLKTKNKTSRSSIEETYKEINPELAALREEERNKVKDGMDPKQAQKARREAVKAYYNKKQSKESR